jgi:hypothetical protein
MITVHLGFAAQMAGHGSQHAQPRPRSASGVTTPAWRSTERHRLANLRLSQLALKDLPKTGSMTELSYRPVLGEPLDQTLGGHYPAR